jgi:hypothetical protein
MIGDMRADELAERHKVARISKAMDHPMAIQRDSLQ